jgi:hypothetical protein
VNALDLHLSDPWKLPLLKIIKLGINQVHLMTLIILASNQLWFKFTCIVLFKFILRYTTFNAFQITIIIKNFIKLWLKSHLGCYNLLCWSHCHLGFNEIFCVLMNFWCILFLWENTLLLANCSKLLVLYIILLMGLLENLFIVIDLLMLEILLSFLNLSLPFKMFFLLAHL